MSQMGHTSPNLALAIYAKSMHRGDGERERLAALVGHPYRATTGNGALVSDDRKSEGSRTAA